MYVKRSTTRICQGDIVGSFEYKVPVIKGSEIGIERTILPYAIIMSQDCDLERDYLMRTTPSTVNPSNDKYLQSILVCPAYNADLVKEGTHLSILGYKMNTWGGDKWKDILSNQNERFHYLPASQEFGFPDLIIDFKQYFTILRNQMYDDFFKAYISSLDALFREDISHRFASYLSRIGLPVIPTPSAPTMNTNTATTV